MFSNNRLLIFLTVLLAMLCAVIWATAEIGWVNKVAGIVANAIAIFVTVSGILSLVEKRITDDLNQQRGIDAKNPLTDIFVDKANEDQPVFEQIRSCLPDDNCSDLKESSISAPDQFYVALQDRLKNCKILLVPYYNTPASWIIQRIRLYHKYGILRKVIVCTNKNEQVKDMLTKEGVSVEVVYSKQLDCEKLKSAIDKKMGQ